MGTVAYFALVPRYSGEAFCKVVLDQEGWKSLLVRHYDDNRRIFEGKSYEHGTASEYFIAFKQCAATKTALECWNELHQMKVTINREAVDKLLAVGALLHDCSQSVIEGREPAWGEAS